METSLWECSTSHHIRPFHYLYHILFVSDPSKYFTSSKVCQTCLVAQSGEDGDWNYIMVNKGIYSDNPGKYFGSPLYRFDVMAILYRAQPSSIVP